MAKADKLLSGPARLWIADEGTDPPVPGVTPPSPWRELGDGLYTEDGIRINEAETFERTPTLNSTLTLDVDRTQEMFTISVNIQDATLDTMAVLKGLPLTTTAAASSAIGTKRMNLKRGFNVKKYALLLGGYTPYEVTTDGETDMYFWWPRVFVASVGEYTRMKGKQILPVVLELLEDDTHGAGYVIAKSAEATG